MIRPKPLLGNLKKTPLETASCDSFYLKNWATHSSPPMIGVPIPTPYFLLYKFLNKSNRMTRKETKWTPCLLWAVRLLEVCAYSYNSNPKEGLVETPSLCSFAPSPSTPEHLPSRGQLWCQVLGRQAQRQPAEIWSRMPCVNQAVLLTGEGKHTQTACHERPRHSWEMQAVRCSWRAGCVRWDYRRAWIKRHDTYWPRKQWQQIGTFYRNSGPYHFGENGEFW